MVFKNKIMVFLLLLLVLIIAGCYSTEIHQTINEDGSADVTLTYDFTRMMEMVQQMQEEENPAEDIASMCEEFKETSTVLGNADCVFENNIMVITGSLPPGSISLRETSDFHIYNIKDVYGFMASIEMDVGDEESQFSDEELRSLGEGAGMMNLEMEYVIEVNGEILRTDVGEITGNTVRINMFDLPDTDNPVVEIMFEASTGKNGGGSPITIILIILLIIIGGVIGYYLYTQEQEKKNKPAVSARTNELAGWIRQYHDKYPEEILRKVLEEKGYTKEEIDEAFRNK